MRAGSIRVFAARVVALAAAAGTAWVVGCGPSYPNCDDDEDCHEGEFCVNGQCQLCRTGADCPAGQDCVGGRCDEIPGFCAGAGDCPNGQECQNNRCVPVQSVAEIPEPSEPAESGLCQLQPVYFAFDADGLDGSARNSLEANARCIQERQITAIRLTGHTDPRGTEEYNLALGDRRARSAQQFLQSLGVTANVSIGSMGEEMAQGQDEETWARDRRVDVSAR